MVAPVHDGDIDCGYSVWMVGKVNWNINASHAVVTVTGSNGFSESETLWWPGDYNINLDYPEEGTIYTVTCTLISAYFPNPEDIRTGIVYPDDFHFVYPQKYWRHIEVFEWLI
jgi:hypothetical protein